MTVSFVLFYLHFQSPKFEQFFVEMREPQVTNYNRFIVSFNFISGRGGKKKKKKPVSKKTLKKLFPYLLIPFMIQAALLPIVLKFLLFVAIKALIAGKLALILVAFNAIRNASMKSDEDEYIERMSYDHYGYGQGEEYGAWINRRAYTVPQNSEEEFAEPYSAYNPVQNEP